MKQQIFKSPSEQAKCKHNWPTHWIEQEQVGEFKNCTKCGKVKWANWVHRWWREQERERTTCQNRCPVHCKKEDAHVQKGS